MEWVTGWPEKPCLESNNKNKIIIIIITVPYHSHLGTLNFWVLFFPYTYNRWGLLFISPHFLNLHCKIKEKNIVVGWVCNTVECLLAGIEALGSSPSQVHMLCSQLSGGRSRRVNNPGLLLAKLWVLMPECRVTWSQKCGAACILLKELFPHGCDEDLKLWGPSSGLDAVVSLPACWEGPLCPLVSSEWGKYCKYCKM